MWGRIRRARFRGSRKGGRAYFLASMFFSLAVLLGAAPAPAHAEKRVALVIGNAAYAHADRLANSEADAAAVAAMFTKLGFETAEAKTNLSLGAMKRALADFELAAKGADIAAIYYSGHGVQIGGQDYLVPIDAELAREVDVDDETVALDRKDQSGQDAVIADVCAALRSTQPRPSSTPQLRRLASAGFAQGQAVQESQEGDQTPGKSLPEGEPAA